jgi:Flp pilus assembly protein CpaB
MKGRTLLLLSIGAGLLAIVLARAQLSRERGEAVSVFRAKEDVDVGRKLVGKVETVTLPGDKLFPNLLKEAPNGEMEAYVTKTPLVAPIHKGEIVLYRHLERSSDRGLPQEIPSGMKAISIKVDESTAVGFLLEPGDHVDVLAAVRSTPPAFEKLATRPLRKGAAAATAIPPPAGPLPEVQPLLEDVQVLAVGHRFRRSDPRDEVERRGYPSVTLLVTEEGARKIAQARDVLREPMTLVLRSAHDEVAHLPAP